jgi:hypothetical protein
MDQRPTVAQRTGREQRRHPIPEVNPRDPAAPGMRVCRGGSWHGAPLDAPCGQRKLRCVGLEGMLCRVFGPSA